ncbi:endonuclease/exonuclease/phosphatase family protein [Kribbella sp. NPDC051952]|uniref:endonuclease/exonuclease/phosphatase family protein n=1 Tax=Kribbella sp. NPDC051952 TaxID=3154851 RepID=UPI0034122402
MASRLTVATLNTRGLPLKGSRISERFTAIAAHFNASEIDLVCLQEVFAYRHLTHLRKGMPSFPHAAYRRSVVGPAGGLVTLSRLRFAGTAYARLPRPSRHSGLPARTRLNALHSGMLTVRLSDSGVRVINIHPTANTDGNWSEQNRFRQLQHDQLTALAQAVKADSSPTVVCGDFNVAQASTLHSDLRHQSGLQDTFNAQCPPTYHPKYLAPGNNPHCIDFILTTKDIEVTATNLLFTDHQALPTGPTHLSDHIGLSAQLHFPSESTP